MFWKCEQEISYREMTPVSVHSLEDIILVLFNQVLVLYKLNEHKVYEKISTFSPKISTIKQIYLLSDDRNGKVNILSVN